MRRIQLGIGFEVWDAQQTWFWYVIDPDRNGGTIGAAVTEAEAVRAACLSIEEMSAQRRSRAAALCVSNGSASMRPCPQSESMANWIALAGWECSLESLKRYLACFSNANA